jgi:hypothetical protein
MLLFHQKEASARVDVMLLTMLVFNSNTYGFLPFDQRNRI